MVAVLGVLVCFIWIAALVACFWWARSRGGDPPTGNIPYAVSRDRMHWRSPPGWRNFCGMPGERWTIEYEYVDCPECLGDSHDMVVQYRVNTR